MTKISSEPIPEDMKRLIDVAQERDRRLVEYANKCKTTMLALIASYVPRQLTPSLSEYAHIGLAEEFGVETVISMIAENPSNLSKVMLLINSLGGSLESSYKTAKAIRRAFKDITVFVPHVALSGGTLLALTGNRIVMGRMSNLSALDVQISYRDGAFVSANALLRSKERLDEYFKDKKVEDVPYTWKALADKLDPVVLEDWISEQETCRQYVEEILKLSGYSNYKRVAQKLVYELPSHSIVLDYEHAKLLGLKVEPYTDHREEWEIMRYWLSKYLLKSTDRHLIRCIIPRSEKKKNEVTTTET